MAAEVKVDVDPADVGFDAERLRRIDHHFARYVEDGLLPGYLAVVSRHGRIAHVASHGSRDVEANAPVEADTIWRIFSMTKPITSVVAMTLFEEGLVDLTDPISRWLPEFARPRVYTKGSAPAPAGPHQGPRPAPRPRARPRADPAVAPAHTHLRAHLRVPPRTPGRRDVPGGGVRVEHAE